MQHLLHTHTHVNTCAYTYVYVYVCVCVHAYVYVYVFVYVCVLCICICMCICICISVSTESMFICVYMPVHARTNWLSLPVRCPMTFSVPACPPVCGQLFTGTQQEPTLYVAVAICRHRHLSTGTQLFIPMSYARTIVCVHDCVFICLGCASAGPVCCCGSNAALRHFSCERQDTFRHTRRAPSFERLAVARVCVASFSRRSAVPCSQSGSVASLSAVFRKCKLSLAWLDLVTEFTQLE